MADFYDVQVTVYTPDAFTVEWKLNSLVNPGTATVKVLRSEAPEGHWADLITADATEGTYSDKHISMGNLFRTVYYKLICTDDGSDYESDPISTITIPDAKTRNMIKRLGRKLRQPHNSDALPVYFYVRRTWGPRCECASRGKTSSTCPMCFGTGFLHGYYTPIPGYVSRSSERKRELNSPGKNINEDIRYFWTMPYPLLNDGDFFVSARNDRWRIIPPVDVPEVFGHPLRQKFNASRMSRGDIIYQIEVPMLHELESVHGSHKWKEQAIT